MFFLIVLPPPYSVGSEDHSLGVKQPRHEAGHFLSCNAEVKNNISTPSFHASTETTSTLLSLTVNASLVP